MASRRIALAFPTGSAFLERIQRGVIDYARANAQWAFFRNPEQLSPSLEWLVGWRGDGVLCLLTAESDAEIARNLQMPVVDLAGWMDHPRTSRARVDDLLVGHLAAEHLLARGFRRFGYYGLARMPFSEMRRDGFTSALQAAGQRCEVFEHRTRQAGSRQWRDYEKTLVDWLRSLELPCGILACTDQRARMLIEAAEALGIRIPEELGLVGVDNDPVACEFSDPPLSSVDRNDYRVGYEAATLLDRIINGEEPPGRDLWIEPERVVERRSTDTVIVDDPFVAAAVQYIHRHLDRSFGVEALLDCTGVSRRRLEQGFRTHLQCSPYEYIRRHRVETARRLLTERPELSLADVAEACGFTSARQLRVSFVNAHGVRPAVYRRENSR